MNSKFIAGWNRREFVRTAGLITAAGMLGATPSLRAKEADAVHDLNPNKDNPRNSEGPL